MNPQIKKIIVAAVFLGAVQSIKSMSPSCDSVWPVAGWQINRFKPEESGIVARAVCVKEGWRQIVTLSRGADCDAVHGMRYADCADFGWPAKPREYTPDPRIVAALKRIAQLEKK